MSFESPQPSAESRMDQATEIKLINKMQLDLANRFYGFHDSSKTIEWIDSHSMDFRAIVEDKVNHKDLLLRYSNSPEEALAEAEHALYATHGQEDTHREGRRESH